MKRILLITVAVLLIASFAHAQLPPVGYIGLYLNTEPPSPDPIACATGAGFYPVEMYIWALPNEKGMMCAEFMVTYPVNVIQSTVTTNPLVCVTLGTLDTGMSACLCTCAWDWTWYFHQLLYVTDPTPTECTIVKHPDPNIPCVQHANCDPGYPTECCIVHTKLLLNQECPPENPVGTEEASWGAIKDLVK
ncbi:MAG: hypothetical protein JSV33_01995 [bacterium]|nr:MAG: hypothetical protein JSV33_01995 [bacterium]